MSGAQTNMERCVTLLDSLFSSIHFNQSGLTKACLESSYTLEFVSKTVLDYIKKWIPEPRVGVLAGSSVHADRMFLATEMPDIVDHLHYRSAFPLYISYETNSFGV